MNHNEEVPDFLGGLGDMLPADVLKKVNELLEQLHRKDKDHQGSPVFIYAPGSQYVDKLFNFGDKRHPDQKSELQIRTSQPPNCKFDGTEELPEVLRTDKAMALWRKAQRAGYVDDNYLPLISRTQSALLPMQWPNDWASVRSGRYLRRCGTGSICGAIIIWLLPGNSHWIFKTS